MSSMHSGNIEGNLQTTLSLMTIFKSPNNFYRFVLTYWIGHWKKVQIENNLLVQIWQILTRRLPLTHGKIWICSSLLLTSVLSLNGLKRPVICTYFCYSRSYLTSTHYLLTSCFTWSHHLSFVGPVHLLYVTSVKNHLRIVLPLLFFISNLLLLSFLA